MGKKRHLTTHDPIHGPGYLGPEPLPETDVDLLRQAAGGKWEEFLRQYLMPCWREVVLGCRKYGIPLVDTDDAFQELIIRLIRDGRLGRWAKDAAGRDVNFRGNVAARFLKSKESPLASVRFRTYLKGTIRNVIWESIRNRKRQPHSIQSRSDENWEPSIDESITLSIERQWIVDCLEEAAVALKSQSRKAATKGKQRLFDILYLELVNGWTQTRIARHFHIDPSTVSELREASRRDFVRQLQKITDVHDLKELRIIVSDVPDSVRLAFSHAQDNTSR